MESDEVGWRNLHDVKSRHTPGPPLVRRVLSFGESSSHVLEIFVQSFTVFVKVEI